MLRNTIGTKQQGIREVDQPDNIYILRERAKMNVNFLRILGWLKYEKMKFI